MKSQRFAFVFLWFFLGVGVLIFSKSAHAEPWLSSRYAQNCATCHAPGRVNVTPTERRCSLSCQGCHTNPNGGGLRNEYGKWMQQRWLNSGYIPGYKLNKPRPAVTDQQHYAADRLRNYLSKADAKDVAKYKAKGFPLRETAAQLPESEYDRRSTNEKYVEPDISLARMRIPEGDPWRLRRENYFNAGLDLRYFLLRKTGTDGKTTNQNLLMGTDVAVSVEPVHRYTLVFESRFNNSPGNPQWEQGFTSSQVRSAYLLVDDLPYNTFVQYGLFRPMFGNFNPDHTSLFKYATDLSQTRYFHALSIGTAPNVPFFNFHYIMPVDRQGGTSSNERGYAANAGLRFVTLGLYTMLSYWNTQVDQGGGTAISLKRNMINWTGGMTAGPLNIVADVTRYQKEQVGGAKNAGWLLVGETRLRTYKEWYLKGVFETMNTSAFDPYLPGSARQLGLGVNTFLISGVELEFMYKDRIFKTTGQADLKDKLAWFQAHLYF